MKFHIPKTSWTTLNEKLEKLSSLEDNSSLANYEQLLKDAYE